MSRVLISAASPVVRAGLEALLSATQSIKLAAVNSQLATLEEEILAREPDVVLLELERPQNNLLLSLLNSASEHTAPGFVILSDDWHDAFAAEALRAGARAVLPAGATGEEIIAAVEAAAAGLVVLHPDAIESLLPERASSARGGQEPVESLTARELEVLAMLAEGVGNKTIAWRLGISEHTVKFHVASILSKLNAGSRTEAVTMGIRQGLIML